MLTLALSPYELTARSKAAALSLLLGEQTLTLAPGDMGEGDGEPTEVDAGEVIAFARLWGWTRELWDDGVLTAGVGDAASAECVRAAWARIQGDEALPAMRRLARGKKDAPAALDAGRMVRDMARGGVDPSVGVAVEAGLMEAASRARVGVVRAGGESALARLIERAGEPMARLTLAAPEVADEATVTEMRRLMVGVLAPLRNAVGEVIRACYEGAEAERVREVCDRRVEPMALEAVREAVSIETAMERGVRAVAVRLSRVPSDVVLRAAEGAVGRSRERSEAAGEVARTAVVLTVKPLAWDASSI